MPGAYWPPTCRNRRHFSPQLGGLEPERHVEIVDPKLGYQQWQNAFPIQPFSALQQ